MQLTSVIAVAAVATFFFGIKEFSAERTVRNEELEKQLLAQHRAQASLFDCWVQNATISTTTRGPQQIQTHTIRIELRLSNASAQAFRSVEVWGAVKEVDTEPRLLYVGTVAPTQLPDFQVIYGAPFKVPDEFAEKHHGVFPAVISVSAWFVDANGVQWHRYNDGRLLEEKHLGQSVELANL